MRTSCVLRGGLLAAAAFVGILSAGDTSGEAARRCCSKLAKALPHRVLKPDTADYKHANNQYWSATAVLSPRCIVRPADVAGVSTIIKILTVEATSDLPACPFAIKSSGHMPVPGANNIDNGIVVDLSEIDGIILSPDHKILSVETGSTWQEVANEVNGTGLGIPSGHDPTTAVGGFTLGGGISFFAPKIGFSADNIVNFEVVLASGDIVNANATSNSDLWMALKGGGSNFGIVTRFDFNTFPLPHLWSAGIPLPVDKHTTEFALHALHGLTQIHRAFPNLAYSNVFSFNASRTPFEGSIWNSAVFSGNDIKELRVPSVPVAVGGVETEVSIMDHMSETCLADLLEGSDRHPFGYRNYMATVTFINDWTTLSHVHELTVDLYKTLRHVEDMEWRFAYESIPHLYTEHSISRGGNVLGLNRTKEDLILMHLAPRWSSASDDTVIFNTARQWVEQVKRYTKSVGTSSDYVYLNYASGFQDPIASYGEDSVRFLEQVARKYDPSGVFQKAAKGGFKIPGMDKSGGIEHDEL